MIALLKRDSSISSILVLRYLSLFHEQGITHSSGPFLPSREPPDRLAYRPRTASFPSPRAFSAGCATGAIRAHTDPSLGCHSGVRPSTHEGGFWSMWSLAAKKVSRLAPILSRRDPTQNRPNGGRRHGFVPQIVHPIGSNRDPRLAPQAHRQELSSKTLARRAWLSATGRVGSITAS